MEWRLFLDQATPGRYLETFLVARTITIWLRRRQLERDLLIRVDPVRQ